MQSLMRLKLFPLLPLQEIGPLLVQFTIISETVNYWFQMPREGTVRSQAITTIGQQRLLTIMIEQYSSPGLIELSKVARTLDRAVIIISATRINMAACLGS
jgi:hypothetical protein